MSKLENWGDLFKYNKELLEDDYNQGQGVVIKTKSKATDNVTVSQWESVEEVFKAQIVHESEEIGEIKEAIRGCAGWLTEKVGHFRFRFPDNL